MDTFAARDAQLLEEAWKTGIQRTFAETAGFLRQRTGEPGFADAGGTGDQQRLTALDPSRCCQSLNQLKTHGLRPKIDPEDNIVEMMAQTLS